MSTYNAIHIAAAIITDSRGRCLLVRKRGTRHFIQPGGKLEAGEAPLTALRRELVEELDIHLDAAQFSYLGRFSDRAINEPGRELVADIYHSGIATAAFTPAAEIDEVQWYDPQRPSALLLAPLTENQLMPLLRSLTRVKR